MDQTDAFSREERFVEERFVKELTQIVLDNLTDEQFSVKKLAESYGIGRSQLLRKVKKATGKSVSQFIREIRLTEAMKLLQQDEFTISEVSYRVGFSSPTYFNTCFKDYFGYPPGEAKLRQHLNQESAIGNGNKSSGASNLKKRSMLVLLGIAALMALVALFHFSNIKTPPNSLSDSADSIVGDSISNEKTIAVLPLKNWSGDPALEYISDGITDAIILKLVGIGAIGRVVPFTSMLSYKQTDKSIAEIAKELGVTNILQGSFQLSGNEVSVKLQLIDGPAEDHFWESEYKSNWQSTEIFDIQAAVARDVANNINALITESENELIRKVPTSNKEAYKMYLQAQYRFRQLSFKGFESAITLYNRAIALDSSFIEPYVGLATTYMLSGLVWGINSQEEAWSRAKPIFLRVLEVDQANSNLHQERIKIGLYEGLFYYEYDLESIEKSYTHSPYRTSIFPDGSGYSYFDYARKTGRHEDVLMIANKMIDTYPGSSGGYVAKACALFFLGRTEEALTLLNEHEKLYNDHYFFLMETAKYYHYLGEQEKSRGQLELFKEQFTDRPPIIHWLDAIHAEMDGDTQIAQKTLAELQELYERKTSGSPAWFLALYYCHVKDYDQALEWLYKSYDQHEVEMTWLKEEPVLRPLRNDPRYLDLYDKVGFSKILP